MGGVAERDFSQDSLRDDLSTPGTSSPATSDGDTLAAFALGLSERLAALGYAGAQGMPERFFSLVGRDGSRHSTSIDDLLAYEPLFETLVARDAGEHARFHEDYVAYARRRHDVTVPEDAARRIRQARMRRDGSRQAMEGIDRRLRQEEKRLERLLEEQERQGDSNKPLAGRRKVDGMRRRLGEVSDTLSKAMTDDDRDACLSIPAVMAGERPVPSSARLNRMEEALRQASRKAMLSKDAAKTMKTISEMGDAIKRMRSERRAMGKTETPDDVRKRIEQAKAERRRELDRQASYEQELRDSLGHAADVAMEAGGRGASSGKSHRPEFVRRNNSARTSDALGEPDLDRRFDSLSAVQKQAIRDYISENALRFKTRMRRNLRTRSRHEIDMPETVRRACATSGIPIDLRFVRDRPSKASLLMFLDISGSCREASELMLTFMYSMADVFPGGCKAYAFVNSLNGVSEMFDQVTDAESAVRTVLSTIPTRGVYSDYHKPFSAFRDDHMSEVTKDTIVFFIGDARNNRNEAGEDNIKAIARKAKRAYWLNTEPTDKWNKADSIMGLYARYMTDYAQVTTPGELIGFLTEVR